MGVTALHRVTLPPPEKAQAAQGRCVLCPLVRGHLFSLSGFRPEANEPVTPMTSDGQGYSRLPHQTASQYQSYCVSLGSGRNKTARLYDM